MMRLRACPIIGIYAGISVTIATSKEIIIITVPTLGVSIDDDHVSCYLHIQQTCSTGSRSRSATPDSLDSLPDQDQWTNGSTQIPSFVSIFDNNPAQAGGGRSKQNLRRTPSAPLRGSAELFRGSHIRCDIPCFTADGVELLNFQRLGSLTRVSPCCLSCVFANVHLHTGTIRLNEIGTITLPRIRSGSDPSCTIG
jgi:hypothetical protein